MNKSELVESMASAAGISKAAAEKSLNGALSAITDSLKKGDISPSLNFWIFISPKGLPYSRATFLAKYWELVPEKSLTFGIGTI